MQTPCFKLDIVAINCDRSLFSNETFLKATFIAKTFSDDTFSDDTSSNHTFEKRFSNDQPKVGYKQIISKAPITTRREVHICARFATIFANIDCSLAIAMRIVFQAARAFRLQKQAQLFTTLFGTNRATMNKIVIAAVG